MLKKPVIRTPVAISLGAIAGALSRYYLTLWFNQLFGTGFPYSTLIINVSGCFVMGLFTTLALGRSEDLSERSLLSVFSLPGLLVTVELVL